MYTITTAAKIVSATTYKKMTIYLWLLYNQPGARRKHGLNLELKRGQTAHTANKTIILCGDFKIRS